MRIKSWSRLSCSFNASFLSFSTEVSKLSRSFTTASLKKEKQLKTVLKVFQVKKAPSEVIPARCRGVFNHSMFRANRLIDIHILVHRQTSKLKNRLKRGFVNECKTINEATNRLFWKQHKSYQPLNLPELLPRKIRVFTRISRRKEFLTELYCNLTWLLEHHHLWNLFTPRFLEVATSKICCFGSWSAIINRSRSKFTVFGLDLS